MNSKKELKDKNTMKTSAVSKQSDMNKVDNKTPDKNTSKSEIKPSDPVDVPLPLKGGEPTFGHDL